MSTVRHPVLAALSSAAQMYRQHKAANGPTDDELEAIYKRANGEDVGKAQPITTARVFKAMRAVAGFERDALAVRVAELEAAIHGVLQWDEKRNFPIPYKVRDPLRAALTTPESKP